MDENKLKDIIQNQDSPTVDENAKKRALNLAMAEFDTHQKEKSEKNSKKFQGFGLLARLISNSNQNERRKTMEERKRHKLIYGGMATAAAVIIVAGISLQNAPVFDEQMSVEHASLETFNYANSERKNKERQDAAKGQISPREQVAGNRPAVALEQNSLTPVPIESFTSTPAPAKKDMKVEKAARLRAKPESAPIFGLQADSMMLEEEVAIMPADNDIVIDQYREIGRDKFADFTENPFKAVSEEPVSTFSVDVDTASYSFVRRQLNHGTLPQKDAVRIEEMINYFDYQYAGPDDKAAPFQQNVSISDSPWNDGKKLMHIGIQGYEMSDAQPKSNIVFLLDVSGSMNSHDKLPLVKNSMKMLLSSLNPDDTVAIAVYAGAAGTVLEPTKVSEKSKIIAAFDKLSAGGSTAGAEGINLAYQLAEENFDEDAVNRVILATDGDFNVGITNREELKDFVERKREKGVFLSVLGFGQGNYNDDLMQALAQNGNGIAAYIDNLNEARKVLVEEATSSLFPIAKDVKIQIEFNPAQVSEYRLVGYETRALNREDFNNDKVDAGDIGAGHSVTAIYEFTPIGTAPSVDPLRYGAASKEAAKEGKPYFDQDKEIAFLKLRYKLPKENKSNLITQPVFVHDTQINAQEVQFASAVASFAQILKGGKYTGNMSYDDVIALAQGAKGEDRFGYRAEFIQLVRLAESASAMQPR